MGVFDSGYEQAISDAALTPVERAPAGFLEAFSASYEATRQEDLSISERQNFLQKIQQRSEKIAELTGKPFDIDITDPGLPGLTTVERARLAAEKRISELAAQYPEVKTDDELRAEIIEDSKRIRQQTGKVLENTTLGGKAGSFVGAMAASMTDPLVLGTIPFGASASAGILRTFLIEAGFSAASEALVQPFVYRYKQQLNSPYDLGDAASRIALAGIGGGALAGTLKAAGRGIGYLAKPRVDGIDDLLEAFERHSARATQDVRDAAHVLGDYADVLRESPFLMGGEMTTLYRVEPAAGLSFSKTTGEGVTRAADEVRGRWFTDDPQNLETLMSRAGPDATLYAVRVPTDELDRYRASNLPSVRQYSGDPKSEYFLPRELADQKIEVTRPGITQPETDELHLKATAKAVADVEAGRPVDVSEIIPQPQPRVRRAPTPTENQSLGQFIKNSGGVSIEQAGALRGEYEGLFENGGRQAGIIKRRAGKSPDELAQLAHESGFIEEPDSYVLAQALERDLRGEKVYSVQGDTFERRMDLQLEREYQRWAEMEEAAYWREQEAQARAILEVEDVQIPTGELRELEGGEVMQLTRSGREVIAQADDELRIGEMLKKCMIGGGA